MKTKNDGCSECHLNLGESVVNDIQPYCKRVFRKAALAILASGALVITNCNTPEQLGEDFTVAKVDTSSIFSERIPNAEATSVADKLPAMLKLLGIVSTEKIVDEEMKNAKAGDLIGFSYRDDAAGVDYNLTLNDNLTTVDTLVFDGTAMNLDSGEISYIRQDMASTDDGIIVKEMVTVDGEAISEYSKWNYNPTYRYVPTSDGIEEYQVYIDGSESYLSIYEAKGQTTVSKVYNSGASTDLTGISVLILHNIDTGLHPVHM